MKKFDLLSEPLIYLITDGKTTVANFNEKKSKILKLIETAVQTKISLIQIREKQLSARLTFQLVQEAAKLTRGTATRLLVNDRADLALAAAADGVHLTSRSLSVQTIRRCCPKDFIVGFSAHTIEEAEIAKKQKANFVTFSPIFASPGKGKPQGVEKLRQICERLNPFPVIALGGIDKTNVDEVLAAGASGFAAIRFLNSEENLRKLTADLRKQTRAYNEV